MEDSINLAIDQSLQAESGTWYRNLQVLGRGGNAATFLVVATSGQNRGVPFAVKIFRRLSKPERRDNFLQEMKFLETCSHPSVLRIFDTGVFYGEHPFLIAEYLPRTLYQIIRADNSSITQKISFATQLLSALAYLNVLAKPVIHRDIKPQNILIKGNSCVLGDFGLMKWADADTVEDQAFLKESLGVGMPGRYRTPDQVAYLKGESPLTTGSDIFQLGLVLAELFTGRNPEKPSAEFTDAVELEPLSWVRGGLGGMIANVINQMLQIDPPARPNAVQLLNAWEGIFREAVARSHALEGRAMQ
ncbi:MAG: serine/threonine-protein kinase [Tepidisphaeraceae bacterium]